MHPPLDRPHPDCQDVIEALKECHESYWRKLSGVCNPIKFSLDRCFKAEKQKILRQQEQEFVATQPVRMEVMKQAFRQEQTVLDYIQNDPDYQRARAEKAKNPEYYAAKYSA